MTDTNCTDESNALIKSPKLLSKEELKIRTDLNDVIRQSPVVSLFKSDGMSFSKFSSFYRHSKHRVVELKPPNQIVSRLSFGLAYKDCGGVANIRYKF